MRRTITALLGMMLAAAAQDSKSNSVEEQTVDVILLKNGNSIEGKLLGKNAQEILIDTKTGRMGVRKEYVQKLDRVTRRVVRAKPVERKPLPPLVDSQPKPTATETKQPPVLQAPASPLHEQIVGALKQMSKAGFTERDQLTRMLASTGGEGQKYLASIIDKYPDLCEFIATAIANIRDTEGLSVLASKLTSEDAKVRAVAARVLGVRRYQEAHNEIAGLMSDPSELVREASLDALGSLKAQDRLREIIEKLDDPNEIVARKAQSVAALLGNNPELSEQASNATLSVLDRGGIRARALGCGLAGQLQIRDAIPKLIDLINDGDKEIRANAIIALGDLKSTEAIEAMSNRLLFENEPWVKIQIIQAFQTIAKLDSIPTLIDLLRDRNEEVMHRAGVALTRITGQNFGEDASQWSEWFEKISPKHQ